LILC